MSEGQRQFRLLTRSDFDGLVCAVLLKDLGILGSIQFVHPKDVQDGKIEVTENDILTNLPYVPGCHLCFDHHESEDTRTTEFTTERHILKPEADSAARVLYDYFGGRKRFPGISEEMMRMVDKADAAQFTREEILYPTGWVLLSFLMDARTGLGRFKEFRISNYQLMMQLIECCREMSVDEILALPDVRERLELYQAHQELFVQQLRACTTVYGNLAVVDLRREPVIYVGNRFMVYALFPECSISMHVMWGLKQQNTVFAIGKSILNRTCPVKVGDLALQYSGGGHDNAGTCQIANERAEKVQWELILKITSRSPELEPAFAG